MAKRMPRVNSLLKKTISDILRKEVFDPRVERVVVTEVKTAPDLASAIVYFSLYGTPEQQASAQAGLDRAASFIQGRAGDELQFHFTPRLKFLPDESIARAERIDCLLKGIDPDAPHGGGSAGGSMDGREPATPLKMPGGESAPPAGRG